HHAATLYAAAHAIAPNNALVANQLGYVHLRMDRPAEAREVLIAAARIDPGQSVLENLMEASRRLRDSSTYQWAANRYAAMPKASAPSEAAPPYVELDPRVFAALSP